jgi:uncharacterized phage protein (TIGR02220 family)
MKNPPSFQFYPQDFLSDLNVLSMNDEQVGKYTKLLCSCWIEDGLENGSPLVEEWFKAHPILRRCFVEKGGKYRNPRLDRERQKQINWQEKSKIGGLHSAEKKKLLKLTSTKGQPKVNQRSTLLSSSSSSTSVVIIREIVSYLNEKTGKNFSPKSKPTIEHISARIAEGRTLDDFKKVIEIKVAKWKGKTWPDTRRGREGQIVSGDDYLRPSTLFLPANFENYLNESATPVKVKKTLRVLQRDGSYETVEVET